MPKLRVMSVRTIPLSVRTLTPFDPSAGYGPAVSSGTSATDASPEDVVVAVAVDAPDVVAPAAPPSPEPQAARMVVRPPSAASPRARRRVIMVGRSSERPASWSWPSSSTTCRVRWVVIACPPSVASAGTVAAADGGAMGAGCEPPVSQRRLRPAGGTGGS